MSSTHHTVHPQGEAAALREALRLALAALEKALDDGCAIETHDRMTIDGDTWTFGGICALAHDALTNESNTTTGGRMMDKVVMWQAVVYTQDPLSGNAGVNEMLLGLHPTNREAMAEARAAMDGRADAHSAAARRVVLPANA